MKKILISVLACVAFASCKLDVIPENAITFPSYFKTEQDFSSVMYQMLSASKHFYDHLPQQYAGELMDHVRTGSWANLRAFNPVDIRQKANWKVRYDVIYIANIILENTFRGEDAGIPAGRLAFYEGQANFSKAWMYFELSRYWGEAIITDGTRTDIPYPKSSMMDVIGEAIRCGELAWEQLPRYADMKNYNGVAMRSKQMGNKGSVAALLAHAYAWRGSLIDFYGVEGYDSGEDYRQSIFWASEVIEGRAGSYSLEPTTEALVTRGLRGTLATSVVTNDTPESILELETDINDIPNLYSFVKTYHGYPFLPTTLTAAAHYLNVNCGITASLLDRTYVFDDQERDMRLPSFFFDGTSSGFAAWDWDAARTLQMVFPRKLRYVQTEAASYNPSLQILRTWLANTVYFRLADIILLRAECNVKLGNDGPAVIDLNTVRTRAGVAGYPAGRGDGDLQMAVFREREKEMAMEGHRFFDIIRNGYHRLPGMLPEAWASLSDRDIAAGAYFLPIGEGAFRRNDLMRQNAYWIRID